VLPVLEPEPDDEGQASTYQQPLQVVEHQDEPDQQGEMAGAQHTHTTHTLAGVLSESSNQDEFGDDLGCI
jgi:hypothetical protein